MVLPKLWCHCDRYWGFLRKCRFPYVPNMQLPFNCPQDALFDPMRWNSKTVRFREHTFLANENVPAALREGTLMLTVAAAGVAPVPSASMSQLELPHGTPLAAVKAAVLRHNPAVRVIKVSNAHLRRLCRWLGSAVENAAFNKLIKHGPADPSNPALLAQALLACTLLLLAHLVTAPHTPGTSSP